MRVFLLRFRHMQLFALPVRCFAQQVITGDPVIIRRAHNEVQTAFTYAFFVMREQRLRDAKVCGSLFLADTLFLAQQCQNDGGDFYLTHGDAGGNFYVGKERNYIFDWDEAMYAPLERDAWVMGCYDWARKLFNDTLKENGIPYQLRMERLAFYCYHMYFFYLGEFLMVHPLSDQSQSILEYLENGWAKYRVGFADTL